MAIRVSREEQRTRQRTEQGGEQDGAIGQGEDGSRAGITSTGGNGYKLGVGCQDTNTSYALGTRRPSAIQGPPIAGPCPGLKGREARMAAAEAKKRNIAVRQKIHFFQKL